MVTAVLDQGGFDVAQAPRATVLGWLQEIVSELVARSRWRREIITVGTTVVGTSQYPVASTVVEADELSVGGARAARVSTDQLWEFQSGDRFTYPGRTVFAPYFSADGLTEGVELYPVPSTAGLTIRALVSASAPTLADDGTAVTALPDDMHGRIVDEAIRLGRRRLFGIEYDESTREGLVVGLQERRNKRLGGGTQQLSLLRRRRG